MMRIHGKSYDGVALLLPTQLLPLNMFFVFSFFLFPLSIFETFPLLILGFYVTSKAANQPAKPATETCEHSNDELTKLFGKF